MLTYADVTGEEDAGSRVKSQAKSSKLADIFAMYMYIYVYIERARDLKPRKHAMRGDAYASETRACITFLFFYIRQAKTLALSSLLVCFSNNEGDEEEEESEREEASN